MLTKTDMPQSGKRAEIENRRRKRASFPSPKTQDQNPKTWNYRSVLSKKSSPQLARVENPLIDNQKADAAKTENQKPKTQSLHSIRNLPS